MMLDVTDLIAFYGNFETVCVVSCAFESLVVAVPGDSLPYDAIVLLFYSLWYKNTFKVA